MTTVIRDKSRRYLPLSNYELQENDVLLTSGEPVDLEQVVARGRLRLAGEDLTDEDNRVAEALVKTWFAAPRSYCRGFEASKRARTGAPFHEP